MSNIQGPNGPKEVNALNLNAGGSVPSQSSEAAMGTKRITTTPATGNKQTHAMGAEAAASLKSELEARRMTQVLSGKISPELMDQLGKNGEIAQGVNNPNAMSDALFNHYVDNLNEDDAYAALENRFSSDIYKELGLQTTDA
jgi:hypothetical protein